MPATSTKRSSRATVTRRRTTTSRSAADRPGAARLPGISRVDQESTRTHGYVVRVDYRRTSSGWRPKHTAFFGDATHGGWRGSRRAAEEYLKSISKGRGGKR